MADYAEHPEKHPPPQELREAWRYKRWGPPNAGGRMDQPAGLIERMEVAENVYRVMSDYKAVPSKDLGKWIKDHKEQYKMWKTIQKLRADG